MELFQSSGIFQVGSIFGGRTRISSRHCSRPGKSINAPSPQTDLSLAWPIYRPVERRIPLFAIQYNSPSTGPPPFFPNRLLRAKAQGGIVARSSFPREGRGKEEGFYTSLEYLEPYVNADQALVQFCLFFPASLSAFIICPDLIWAERALCSVTSISSPSLGSSNFACLVATLRTALFRSIRGQNVENI